MRTGDVKMIRVLLWDVDGTLLDFLAAERAAIRTLFHEFGFGQCSDDALRRYSEINVKYWEMLERKELTKPEILVGRFREFFGEIGIDQDRAEAFNARYQLELGNTIEFCDNSYEIVKSLNGRVLQYVVSNGTVVAQSKKLSLSGIGALVDGVFLSEDVGYEKPDPRFFSRVFEAVGPVMKDEILIVGDSLTSDIRGGNLAGIRTCWYNPKMKPLPEGYRIDHEIRDLHEIYSILAFNPAEVYS